MGPRFNGVEDHVGPQRGLAGHSASMGPRFNGVEDGNNQERHQLQAHASMGPRFNGVEDESFTPLPNSSTTRFNGATL